MLYNTKLNIYRVMLFITLRWGKIKSCWKNYIRKLYCSFICLQWQTKYNIGKNASLKLDMYSLNYVIHYIQGAFRPYRFHPFMLANFFRFVISSYTNSCSGLINEKEYICSDLTRAKGQKLNRENISLYAHLFFQNKQHIVQAQ